MEPVRKAYSLRRTTQRRRENEPEVDDFTYSSDEDDLSEEENAQQDSEAESSVQDNQDHESASSDGSDDGSDSDNTNAEPAAAQVDNQQQQVVDNNPVAVQPQPRPRPQARRQTVPVYDINWTRQDCDAAQFPFRGVPGLQRRMPPSASELDFFRLFVTDKLIDRVVLETNLYGNEQKFEWESQEGLPFARVSDWMEIDSNSLWRFLALCLTTGFIKKPCLQDYWAMEKHFATPGFGECMSRNRFLQIMQMLHFNHGDQPDGDRLWKLRPFYEELTQKFNSVYVPEQNVSIDESLLLYKGRLSFKQYIPLKRSRFGLKSFELCESSSGYCKRFRLYTGQDVDDLVDPDNNHGVSHAIVQYLMSDLNNLGYTLTVDNYYTSPKLVMDMHDARTNCFGTVRANRRGMPAGLDQHEDGTALAKGDISSFSSDKLIALAWKDKKVVRMLSNCHSAARSTTPTEVRGGADIFKPKVIEDYNNTMGGVDRKDQMVKYYAFFRKTIKWYKRLAFALLDIAIFNGFVVWKKQNPGVKAPTLLKFRKAVIRQLHEEVGPDPSSQKVLLRPARGPPPPMRLKPAGHYPESNPPTIKHAVARRTCALCNPSHGKRFVKGESRKRKETLVQCVSCGNIPLCPSPCFKVYHTVEDLEAWKAANI